MAIYKGNLNPPRQVIQNGKFANDGTGDTLRDAADKINDNFKQLWYDLYVPTEYRPGREFVCGKIAGDSYSPDAGEFTITHNDLKHDSDTVVIKISTFDKINRAYKFESGEEISPLTLSIWELDSANIDEFRLKGITTGTARYVDSAEHWRFTKSSVQASAGNTGQRRNLLPQSAERLVNGEDNGSNNYRSTQEKVT